MSDIKKRGTKLEHVFNFSLYSQLIERNRFVMCFTNMEILSTIMEILSTIIE